MRKGLVMFAAFVALVASFFLAAEKPEGLRVIRISSMPTPSESHAPSMPLIEVVDFMGLPNCEAFPHMWGFINASYPTWEERMVGDVRETRRYYSATVSPDGQDRKLYYRWEQRVLHFSDELNTEETSASITDRQDRVVAITHTFLIWRKSTTSPGNREIIQNQVEGNCILP